MEALMQLMLAVEDRGRVPAYHEMIEQRHRQEWPVLWAAIDRVLTEYKLDLVNKLGGDGQ